MQAEVWRQREFVKVFGRIDEGEHLAQPSRIAHQAFGVPGLEEPSKAFVFDALNLHRPELGRRSRSVKCRATLGAPSTGLWSAILS